MSLSKMVYKWTILNDQVNGDIILSNGVITQILFWVKKFVNTKKYISQNSGTKLNFYPFLIGVYCTFCTVMDHLGHLIQPHFRRKNKTKKIFEENLLSGLH